MAIFNKTVITEKGYSLIAKSILNNSKINFTKIVASDYDYSKLSEEDIEQLEALEDIKQSVLVNDVKVINESTVNVSGILSNTELKEEYYLRAIGLFAADPQENKEILYSITVAKEADCFPSFDGNNVSNVLLDLETIISKSSKIDLEVNPNATATIKNLNDLENKINEKVEDITTHLNDITKKVDNIKIPDGTTAEKGIVQLEDSVSSTATNKAATSNSVKNAYDKGVSAYNLASTANGNASSALSRANEAFQSASNGKTAIAGVLGYVSGGNTHQELANEAQYCKNIMANNLNAKGVGANGNYALRDLANSIGNINIQSLGGALVARGTFTRTQSYVTIPLSFTPNVVFTSRDDKYFNVRQEILGIDADAKDIFLVKNSKGKWEMSSLGYPNNNVFIVLGTNSFTWQATGASGDTFNFIALKI